MDDRSFENDDSFNDSDLGDRSQNDDDFGMSGDGEMDGGGMFGTGRPRAGEDAMSQSQLVKNQPHDEEMAVSDSDRESMSSRGSQEGLTRDHAADTAAIAAAGADAGVGEDDAYQSMRGMDQSGAGFADTLERDGGADDSQAGLAPGAADASAVYPSAVQDQMDQQRSMADDDANETSSDEEDDGAGAAGAGATGTLLGTAPAYDPTEFANLPVSQEIDKLFEHIARYKPHQIELDTRLKPFIPDYIPAVGDIDAFIKVPRPDGQLEATHAQLGLGILDEPAASQTDPTVLDLQLRQESKQINLKEALVHSVENADKNGAQIDAWISSIKELHRSKPPPTVTYHNDMPDVEALMQAWPKAMEDMLQQVTLPTAEINMDLAQMVTTICSVLDIPVHEGKLTQSLHVLFTLFSEFKANQHFAMYQGADEGMNQGAAPFGEFGGATGEIAGTNTTFSMEGGDGV